MLNNLVWNKIEYYASNKTFSDEQINFTKNIFHISTKLLLQFEKNKIVSHILLEKPSYKYVLLNIYNACSH